MSIELFVVALLAAVPPLNSVVEHLWEQWAPGEPPVTVLLGALGRGCVARVPASEEAVWADVSCIVESALSSADEATPTAVATGFIEALDGEAIRHGTAAEVRALLGPGARAFIYDLGGFYGTE